MKTRIRTEYDFVNLSKSFIVEVKNGSATRTNLDWDFAGRFPSEKKAKKHIIEIESLVG